MDRNQVPFFEPGIRAVACTNCQSATKLKLQDDQVRCGDCNATYKIIDGVLDLMPPSYSGYQGDSTDVSLPMCRLAAKNCCGHPVMVVRTPSSRIPPMPFRNSVFDIVLNRLAPMDPLESFRLLRSGGYAVEAGWCDARWQEIGKVFGKDRRITFPRDLEPKEALFQAGFSEAESHSWRFTKTRSLKEIIMAIRYAPILRDFDETADRPFLSKLEDLYGEEDGIRLTEGESLTIGRKDDLALTFSSSPGTIRPNPQRTIR